ncbi:MAG TPA: hypothetical protein VGV89_00420 [Thermoplasmata archaeon]|nr:hypothetical protein [Thermoplasmata archaeon]
MRSLTRRGKSAWVGHSVVVGGVLLLVLLAVGGAATTGTSRTYVAPFKGKVFLGGSTSKFGCGSGSARITTPANVSLATGAFAWAGMARAHSCAGAAGHGVAIASGAVGLVGPTFKPKSSGYQLLYAVYNFSDKIRVIEGHSNPNTFVQALWFLSGVVWDLNYQTEQSSNFFQMGNSTLGGTANLWYNMSARTFTLAWSANLTVGHTYEMVTQLDPEVYVGVYSGSDGAASISVAGSIVSFTVK